jgi:uncharacterized SAM-binding protein YcdF (DUF218 family)
VFFFLSKTLDLAVSPLFWVLVLVALGRRWRGHRKLPRWRRAAPVLALVVACVFSAEPVANRLVRSLEEPDLRSEKPDAVYDALVMLGGTVDERATTAWGTPSFNDDVERVHVTFDRLRTGRARVAIVTGGSPKLRPDDAVEAQVVADQLASWGIERDRIVVEDQARNTRENAVLTARIVRAAGYKRLLLVTSAFHMKRALGCFRAEGLEVDALPVDHRSYDPALDSGSWLPRTEALHASSAALREHTGRLVYGLRGYAVY